MMLCRLRGLQAFFWTFRKKLKADPEKTQAIFSKNSSRSVKKLKHLPTENQIFLILYSFYKKNCAKMTPKLIFFTKLKSILKKLKEL